MAWNVGIMEFCFGLPVVYFLLRWYKFPLCHLYKKLISTMPAFLGM